MSGPVMMKVGSRLKSRRQFRGRGSPSGSSRDQTPHSEVAIGAMVVQGEVVLLQEEVLQWCCRLCRRERQVCAAG